MPATYEPIASTTLGSDTTGVSFTSIPQTFTDLVIVAFAPTASTSNGNHLIFNSDTGTNYSRTYLRGTGTAALSGRSSNNSKLYLGGGVTGNVDVVQIMSYSNTNVYKTVLVSDQVYSGGNIICRQVSLWRSTSAITQIDFNDESASGLKAGMIISLYGIKAA